MTDKNSPPPASDDEKIAGLTGDEKELFELGKKSFINNLKSFSIDPKPNFTREELFTASNKAGLSVVNIAREAGDVEKRLETFRKMAEFDKENKTIFRETHFPENLHADFKIPQEATKNILKRKI